MKWIYDNLMDKIKLNIIIYWDIYVRKKIISLKKIENKHENDT